MGGGRREGERTRMLKVGCYQLKIRQTFESESEREKKNCRNLGRTLQNLYLYIVRNQEEKLGTRSGIKLAFSPKSGSCNV